ncbi:hypothetical protein SeMB42_g07367 [Synchytrium endobioticum]|uniref:Uncharacterized protein n=1 Tax=Synchytrium endobioticum TaxID=286115 RepID=A0A507CSA4_9FUNG|nr:hypothetical protein SeMB42_g07367 [Synchytrium endobioticum]TPX42019.1 hypothetical protein SeLEV6574_g05809 [Synchytrium endobioticum]
MATSPLPSCAVAPQYTSCDIETASTASDTSTSTDTDTDHGAPCPTRRGRVATRNNLRTLRDPSKDWNAALNRRKEGRARIQAAGAIGTFIPALATTLPSTHRSDHGPMHHRADLVATTHAGLKRAKSTTTVRSSHINMIASAWQDKGLDFIMAEAAKDPDTDTDTARAQSTSTQPDMSSERDLPFYPSVVSPPSRSGPARPLKPGAEGDGKPKRTSRVSHKRPPRARSLRRQSTVEITDRLEQLAQIAAGFDDGLRELSLQGAFSCENIDNESSRKLVGRSKTLGERHRRRNSIGKNDDADYDHSLSTKACSSTFVSIATTLTSFATSLTAAVTSASPTPVAPLALDSHQEPTSSDKIPASPPLSASSSIAQSPTIPSPCTPLAPTSLSSLEKKTDSAIDFPPLPLLSKPSTCLDPSVSGPPFPLRSFSTPILNHPPSVTSSATLSSSALVKSPEVEKSDKNLECLADAGKKVQVVDSSTHLVIQSGNNTMANERLPSVAGPPPDIPDNKENEACKTFVQLKHVNVPPFKPLVNEYDASLLSGTISSIKLKPPAQSTPPPPESSESDRHGIDGSRVQSTDTSTLNPLDVSTWGISLRKTGRKARSEPRIFSDPPLVNDNDAAGPASCKASYSSSSGFLASVNARSKSDDDTAPLPVISIITSPPQATQHLHHSQSHLQALSPSALQKLTPTPTKSSPPAAPGGCTLSSDTPSSGMDKERSPVGRHLPSPPKSSTTSPPAPRASLDQLTGSVSSIFSAWNRKPDEPKPIVRGSPPKRSNKAQEYAFDAANDLEREKRRAVAPLPTLPPSNATAVLVTPAGLIHRAIPEDDPRVLPIPPGYTVHQLEENAKTLENPALALYYAKYLVSIVDADADASGMALVEALDVAQRMSDTNSGEAQHLLGRLFQMMFNDVQAVHHYGLALKNKHSLAAWDLAQAYELGRGTEKDSRKAVRHLRTAVDAGHRQAQGRLGTALIKGELGLEQDPKEGIQMLRSACEGGENADPAALYQMAWAWEKGVPAAGMLKSDEMALSMLSQSAALGYAPAQDKLGWSYVNGRLGLPRDTKQAIIWYNKAAAQGFTDSIVALGRLGVKQ